MTKHTEKSMGAKIKSGVYFIFIAAILAFASVNLAVQISELSDKKNESESLRQHIEQQTKEIQEDEYLLDADNEMEFIERIAREMYGFASPGERAFFVSDGG